MDVTHDGSVGGTAPPHGLSVSSPRTLLVERALEYLSPGPASAAALVAHVCQLPATPGAVAEHLAATLLAGRPEFERSANGDWSLAGAPASAAADGAAAGAAGPGPRSPGTPGEVPLAGSLPTAAHPPLDFAAALTPLPFAVRASPRRELSALTYAVVDVETTGGSAERGDRITEIAVVVVEDGVVRGCFEWLVNPQRPIPRWITHLTNISWEMVRDKPTFGEICDDVLAVLQGRVFVAHNATFDWKFVCAEVERARGKRLEGERLCTVRLARRVLPQLRRRSLDAVSFHYGVEIASRHRAGGDARATAAVLLRLLRDAGDHGVDCWESLQQFLGSGTGRARRRRRGPAMPHPVREDPTI